MTQFPVQFFVWLRLLTGDGEGAIDVVEASLCTPLTGQLLSRFIGAGDGVYYRVDFVEAEEDVAWDGDEVEKGRGVVECRGVEVGHVVTFRLSLVYLQLLGAVIERDSRNWNRWRL
jgi:hypothetical protein